jgi:hypothetical protein
MKKNTAAYMEVSSRFCIKMPRLSTSTYGHLVVWGVVWLFMVSGGIEVGWPLGFSIWTQTPYVILFVITFYFTLHKVCPKLHLSKKQQFLGHTAVGVFFICIYGLFNRLIPEYGAVWEGLLDYPIREDVADAMFLLIFIWIPAYGLYYSKYNLMLTRQNSQKAIQLAQRQEQLSRQALQLYKSQFSAHLTFNTLSHIYDKIMDQEEAAEPILLLSNILRYNTAAKADGEVKLVTEINYLQDFIRIHQIIYPDLNIQLRVQGDPEHFCILPRILINYVENAIKHGVGNDPAFPITITLSLYEHIAFEVINKVRASLPAEGTRMGLEITQKTLEAFYGPRHTLSIEQRQLAYKVCLKIFPSKNPVLDKLIFVS